MRELKHSDRRKPSEHTGFRRLSAWSHTSAARSTLWIVIATLILGTIFYAACAPKRYSLTVGSISHQTITATRDVVDEIATEERRKAAANAVEPTYHLAEGVSDEVMTNLGDIFAELRKKRRIQSRFSLTAKSNMRRDWSRKCL